MSAHSRQVLYRNGDLLEPIDSPPFMIFYWHLGIDYWSFTWHGLDRVAPLILSFLGPTPGERMHADLHAGGLHVVKLADPDSLLGHLPAKRVVVVRRFEYSIARLFTLSVSLST